MYGPTGFWTTFLLPVGLALWGHLNVRQGPRVFHHHIRDSRLPREFNELKVAQVSDLHISMFLIEGFVDKLLEKLNPLQADLVVLTGDIIDGPLRDHLEDLEKLKSMHAPLGIFMFPAITSITGAWPFSGKIPGLGISQLT